ncbi:hypothetical protein PVAP13_1KG180600 [Panicum virgatum]|nr:hypothetical protein PVAP13_1KG180600 [Panicum virgatum]
MPREAGAALVDDEPRVPSAGGARAMGWSGYLAGGAADASSRPRHDGSRLPARPPRLLVSIVPCGLRVHLRFIGRAQHQLGKLPRNFQVLNVGEESKILQIHHGSSNRQGSQQGECLLAFQSMLKYHPILCDCASRENALLTPYICRRDKDHPVQLTFFFFEKCLGNKKNVNINALAIRLSYKCSLKV